MACGTGIEWTDATWNPVTGCSKVSSGCRNCYAERMARRLMAMGNPNYVHGFRVSTHEHMLDLPLRWRTPRAVFVNSMSDLFHEEVPLSFIKRVFDVMNRAKWHRFQILTKRSERLLELSSQLEWSPNMWMGVTVEDQSALFRVQHLVSTPAQVKFLSCEPLLGPLDGLDLSGIHWVIVGGESGPRARPMERDWVCDVKETCSRYGVPFFFKQWGGTNKKKAGRLLDGRTYDQLPAIAAP